MPTSITEENQINRPTKDYMISDRELISTDIEKYLSRHEEKQILKFLTCGSVDDGKSTLIGRLLHDTNTVYTDHLEAIARDTKRIGKDDDELDLSLLVDGLQAEREQGITIDVAYRYFSTSERKFIIADCPGHQQYTRNMATGASNCDLAVILIDAQQGVQTQTKHHTYVTHLLGIRHLVIAINKMDLVDYEQEQFEAIKSEFQSYLDSLGNPDVQFIPLSAKKGDNVVTRSINMDWYTGPTILSYLHSFSVTQIRDFESFRMVIQRVNHPHDNFRGYSGTLASGTIQKGQSIRVMPSGIETKIERIVTMDGDLEQAFAPMSVTITLEDELDASRGDVLIDLEHPLQPKSELNANLVWMDDDALNMDRKYIVKHGASQVLAKVDKLYHQVHIEDLSRKKMHSLQKNDIGVCKLILDRPICCDTYSRNRMLGGFILIDRLSNRTVAAGMINSSEEGEMLGGLTNTSSKISSSKTFPVDRHASRPPITRPLPKQIATG